jgi:hypothetical protein
LRPGGVCSLNKGEAKAVALDALSGHNIFTLICACLLLRLAHSRPMPSEVFAPIAGFPDYHASDSGRIVSCRVDPQGRERATTTGRDGYARIVLAASPGVFRTLYVHRLVAAAHVPNPHNLPDVNHIDHNKQNNRAENLEWVTHAENLAKARAHHGNWVRSGGASPVAKALKATPIEGGEPVIWASATEFVRARGGKAGWLGNISRAIRTQRPAYGHRWAFA